MKTIMVITLIIGLMLVSGCEMFTEITELGGAITLPCDQTVKCSAVANDGSESNFCRDNGNGWTWSRCAECGDAKLCEERGYASDKLFAGATSRCANIMYLCTDADQWTVCSANNVGMKATANGMTYICSGKTEQTDYYQWLVE